MGTEDLTNFLIASSELPKTFSEDEIAALAAQLHVEEHPAGELLMKESTPACSLMLLLSGEVRRMLADVELDLRHAGESSVKACSPTKAVTSPMWSQRSR